MQPAEAPADLDRTAPLPAVDPALAVEIIIGFIRRQMEQAGFTRLVIGLSGADTVFGSRPTPVDHVNVPSAVFSHPPVGTVGMTEAEARRRGSVDIYKSEFRPLKHTLSGRNERSLVKLIVDRPSQKVLGAHMVGMDAPEIIQGIAIAVKLGLTKQQMDETVAIHPTAAEEFVTLRTKLPDPADTAAAE